MNHENNEPEHPRPRKRTLKFAVTSALVSAPLVLGAAGCTPKEEKHVNPGPVEEEIRVNPGPPIKKTEHKTERPVGKTKNERPPKINPGPAPEPPAKTNPGPNPGK